MKENELKEVMNSMYGIKESYSTKRSVDDTDIDKSYRYRVADTDIDKSYLYRIEIRRDEMTEEEIEEIIKKLHNKCFREYHHVLRYKFRKSNSVDKLKSTQDKLYHRHMRKSRITLCCSGTKETDPINKITMEMISKYGKDFLKTITLDSNGKDVDKSGVVVSIPCRIFNNNILEILKESTIDDDSFNESIKSLPETLEMEFSYTTYVPIVRES